MRKVELKERKAEISGTDTYAQTDKAIVEIEEADPWKISTVYVNVVPWSGKLYTLIT